MIVPINVAWENGARVPFTQPNYGEPEPPETDRAAQGEAIRSLLDFLLTKGRTPRGIGRLVILLGWKLGLVQPRTGRELARRLGISESRVSQLKLTNAHFEPCFQGFRGPREKRN